MKQIGINLLRTVTGACLFVACMAVDEVKASTDNSEKPMLNEQHVPIGDRNFSRKAMNIKDDTIFAHVDESDEGMEHPSALCDEGTDHVPVGVRSMPHAEFVRVQEQRAKRAAERMPKEMEVQGEDAFVTLDQDDAIESDTAPLLAKSMEQKGDQDDELIAKKTYYTSHQGAFHRPLAISSSGDSITLEDGSVWQIRIKDRGKTLDWLSGDSLIILPNHSWFSSYHYVLLNQNTGADIKVNMMLGPIYNGVYTHWIIAIDYYNKEVCLEDGTVWTVSGSDFSTLKKWLVNDTVIIGVNDSWFSSKPNILINVNMLNYVAAICDR